MQVAATAAVKHVPPAYDKYVLADFHFPRTVKVGGFFGVEFKGGPYQAQLERGAGITQFRTMTAALDYISSQGNKQAQAVLSARRGAFYVAPLATVIGGGRTIASEQWLPLAKGVHVEAAMKDLRAVAGGGVVIKF